MGYGRRMGFMLPTVYLVEIVDFPSYTKFAIENDPVEIVDFPSYKIVMFNSKL